MRKEASQAVKTMFLIMSGSPDAMGNCDRYAHGQPCTTHAHSEV